MTKSEIIEAKKRANKCPLGPWMNEGNVVYCLAPDGQVQMAASTVRASQQTHEAFRLTDQQLADIADFMANARDDVVWLADECMRLQNQNKRGGR